MSAYRIVDWDKWAHSNTDEWITIFNVFQHAFYLRQGSIEAVMPRRAEFEIYVHLCATMCAGPGMETADGILGDAKTLAKTLRHRAWTRSAGTWTVTRALRQLTDGGWILAPRIRRRGVLRITIPGYPKQKPVGLTPNGVDA